MRHLLILAAVSTACSRAENPFQEEFEVTDLTAVVVDGDRGDVTYLGDDSARKLTVDGLSYGYASSSKNAARNEDGNEWSLELVDGVLDIETRSEFTRAGVDLAITGPGLLDVTLDLAFGTAEVWWVDGAHVVEADRVVVKDVEGGLDATAGRGGADLSLNPQDGDVVVVDASGPVSLALPVGRPYDLEVWADPDYEMIVQDLGFDDSQLGEAFFADERAPATIRVEVHVSGRERGCCGPSRALRWPSRGTHSRPSPRRRRRCSRRLTRPKGSTSRCCSARISPPSTSKGG